MLDGIVPGGPYQLDVPSSSRRPSDWPVSEEMTVDATMGKFVQACRSWSMHEMGFLWPSVLDAGA